MPAGRPQPSDWEPPLGLPNWQEQDVTARRSHRIPRRGWARSVPLAGGAVYVRRWSRPWWRRLLRRTGR